MFSIRTDIEPPFFVPRTVLPCPGHEQELISRIHYADPVIVNDKTNVLEELVTYTNALGNTIELHHEFDEIIKQHISKVQRERAFLTATLSVVKKIDDSMKEEWKTTYIRATRQGMSYNRSANPPTIHIELGTLENIRNQLQDILASMTKRFGVPLLDLLFIDLDEAITLEQKGFEPSEHSFYDSLKTVIAALEEVVRAGKILSYGFQTNAFALPSSDRHHVSLVRLFETATSAVGSSGHHLAAIRCDFNLLRPQLFTLPNLRQDTISTGAFAAQVGCGVFLRGFMEGRGKDGSFLRLKSFAKTKQPDEIKPLLEASYNVAVNLEMAYPHVALRSKIPGLPAEDELSWVQLCAENEDSIASLAEFESSLYEGILPVLVPHLRTLIESSEDDLRQWAGAYQRATSEWFERHKWALEFFNSLVSDEINTFLALRHPKLAAVPSLEAKSLLLQLSLSVHSLALADLSTLDSLLSITSKPPPSPSTPADSSFSSVGSTTRSSSLPVVGTMMQAANAAIWQGVVANSGTKESLDQQRQFAIAQSAGLAEWLFSEAEAIALLKQTQAAFGYDWKGEKSVTGRT
jgi:hypothetical protein